MNEEAIMIDDEKPMEPAEGARWNREAMADTKTIIEQASSAFNKRDIDGALALMARDVSWPKASEAARSTYLAMNCFQALSRDRQSLLRRRDGFNSIFCGNMCGNIGTQA